MTESAEFWSGPDDSEDEFNLTVVRHGNDIVMGRKTRGFGKGRLVLPGGKDTFWFRGAHTSTSPLHSAAREVGQEAGISLSDEDLAFRGILHVTTVSEDDVADASIRLFVADLSERPQLEQSDELLDLGWHDVASLPYDQMPRDYSLWLPHVLEGFVVDATIVETDAERVEATVIRMSPNPGTRPEIVS